ncbi:hypothetical protein MTYP_03264 [Methylophilaceae bacterium]|nr:hypothetical protein MTYP_03264 [Methylophilaceae bacterium]
MSRAYYYQNIRQFLADEESFVIGELVKKHQFAVDEQQRNAWIGQIRLLKTWLKDVAGYVMFEYSIPRMGKRVDCIAISGAVIFAIEFKVGATFYEKHAIDQVVDYALDLKNFHEQSHHEAIVPVLICTAALDEALTVEFYEDKIAQPVLTNGSSLAVTIRKIAGEIFSTPIDGDIWVNSIYKPTPTIIEAAQALYRGHSVEEISRSDAGAINLSRTAKAISSIIDESKSKKWKSICFLTGVPGAGKTLAGLNLANAWHNAEESEHAVFLSGNGPLVEVMREALARNEVAAAKDAGLKQKKSATLSKAKAFIQNIHHFRDDALANALAPIERVVVFDEAQRAWDQKQTAAFMKTKKGKPGFLLSEPEFLISVMDRHPDWATIVCLIGGGQEINTGEAGIREWFESIKRSFPHWHVYVSSKLIDHEYTQGVPLYEYGNIEYLDSNDDLHLSVAVRSFRSEKVAAFVKALLDNDKDFATSLYSQIKQDYPIVVTRDLKAAKKWLQDKARGSERYGLVASSGAYRLKPLGINVKAEIDPKNWFLNGKSDVRSAYYLEDVATEFDIQGLELDWTCVAWDGDFRYNDNSWTFKAFRGTAWQDVKDLDARLYLKNAYRVLLTRARQGMVIFVPEGNPSDETRLPEFYDGTYEYLRSIGVDIVK